MKPVKSILIRFCKFTLS